MAGARPKTLPAAVAPVMVGSGVAVAGGGFAGGRALLALVVALSLQVGVNYANDYSDGVRGSDQGRVGPARLVGSGLASPGSVKAAAFAAFAVAAVAGGWLSIMAGPWLLGVGGLSIAAAWLYTGGRHPYGYSGLGEAAVFVFFGVVAVVGTAYVQTGRLSWLALAASVPVGLLTSALLMANNLRDAPLDLHAGKLTLAVRLGDRRARRMYAAQVVCAVAVSAGIALLRPAAIVSLACVPIALRPVRSVLSGESGQGLVAVLEQTGRLELVVAVLLAAGIAL